MTHTRDCGLRMDVEIRWSEEAMVSDGTFRMVTPLAVETENPSTVSVFDILHERQRCG
jgi:hypothetical protein